jgi:hypothetical protein
LAFWVLWWFTRNAPTAYGSESEFETPRAWRVSDDPIVVFSKDLLFLGKNTTETG